MVLSDCADTLDPLAKARQSGTRGQRRTHTKGFISELLSRLSCVEAQSARVGGTVADVANMRSHIQMLECQLANIHYRLALSAHTLFPPLQGDWISSESVSGEPAVMQPYEPEEEADEQLQDMNQDPVGNSGIYEELYASLYSLQSDLCSKLYSHEDAILSADLVEELSIASVKSFRGDLSSQGLQDVSYSSDQAPEVAHLRAAQERLTMWLLHLSKAADLARKVEETPQNRNDPEKMEIQFLEDYHCLLDPVDENKEQNRIDEEEWDDMEVPLCVRQTSLPTKYPECTRGDLEEIDLARRQSCARLQ